MSVGPLTILQGVGGRDETKVVEGDEDGHILITQQNKVLVMKISESAIMHSWYSSPNQPVIAAAKNQDNFENCSCVVVYDERTVARVNNLGSKLAAFEKTRLNRNVFDLLAVKGDHLVIFLDGTVGSLKGLIKGHEEGTSEDWYNPPVLNTNTDTLLSAHLVEQGHVTSLVMVVKSADQQLKICHGRLSLGEEKPVLSGVETKVLGSADDFLSWDVYTKKPGYLLLWKKSGEILYTEDFMSLQMRTVFTEANSYDSEICALSRDYCAIACSKHGEDGGSLKILSLQFQLVSSEAPLKTTIHKGRGLFYVSDYLLIVGGGRVAFGSISELDKQLDQYIGLGLNSSTNNPEVTNFGALSLYQSLPGLYKSGDMNKVLDTLTSHHDVPEDLVIDFLDFITDEAKNSLTNADRKDYLKKIMELELSHRVLAGEMTRLNMQQGLLLVELMCSILEDAVLQPSIENRLLSWLDLILSSNYVHTVLAKDDRTEAVLDTAYEKVLKLEEQLESASNLVCVLEALPALNFTQDNEKNLPYSIQIKQL
eukprot:TRINITY_DN6877_c0_g1_i5.p1 TRINITY_DN6877_c0_g1~~TRINITY_DN6877_c0_g1_i5.p1  ORF type:complete len:538 (-),score=115.96 TRINITY_DN6877_c0_g1_i5:66-1679(-)